MASLERSDGTEMEGEVCSSNEKRNRKARTEWRKRMGMYCAVGLSFEKRTKYFQQKHFKVEPCYWNPLRVLYRLGAEGKGC